MSKFAWALRLRLLSAGDNRRDGVVWRPTADSLGGRMASRVGWFALGFIAAIVALASGAYVYIRAGGVPMATSAAPLPLERTIAGPALPARDAQRHREGHVSTAASAVRGAGDQRSGGDHVLESEQRHPHDGHAGVPE